METGCIDIDEIYNTLEPSNVLWESPSDFSQLYNRDVENLPLLF